MFLPWFSTLSLVTSKQVRQQLREIREFKDNRFALSGRSVNRALLTHRVFTQLPAVQKAKGGSQVYLQAKGGKIDTGL